MQQFGKYLLIERIGVGGMSTVYLGKEFFPDGRPSRVVAIKQLLPELTNAEFVGMFLDEARLTARLEHSNILKLFDLGLAANIYYMAMEYVPGQNLRTLLERFQRANALMPIPEAVYIACKICEGLDYAHRKKNAQGDHLGIVHRDVSPHNILCSYAGAVKIIDFGVAKAAAKVSKTQTGILKGKVTYMSPEQVRGMPIDHRSDIFAVGVVLYEMLTGEKLFDGDSDFAVLEKVRNAEAPPPRELNPSIPPILEKVLLKALARAPADRYQWASEFGGELQRLLITADMVCTSQNLSAFMKKIFAEEFFREEQKRALLESLRPPDKNAPPVPPRASNPLPEEAPPSPTDGTITKSILGRLDRDNVTNLRALDALEQGARLTSEADRTRRQNEARAKRLQAARQYVQAVEISLYQRLLAVFGDVSVRGQWTARRLTLGPAADPGRERAVKAFLKSCELPSLRTLGSWLNPASAPPPPEFAAAIASALGLQPVDHQALLTLGTLRNVLAHLAEYEERGDQQLQEAALLLESKVLEGNRRIIEIPPDKLRELETICNGILSRPVISAARAT